MLWRYPVTIQWIAVVLTQAGRVCRCGQGVWGPIVLEFEPHKDVETENCWQSPCKTPVKPWELGPKVARRKKRSLPIIVCTPTTPSLFTTYPFHKRR